MTGESWKMKRRAMLCVPLAVAATHICVAAQPNDAALVQQRTEQAGTWTFHHEHVLGTSLELRVRARSYAEAQKAEVSALHELDRHDQILSAWRQDSEFSTWAATSFQAVAVSDELFDVLSKFDYWRDQTGGALDASAEAAIRLWRNAISEGRTPTNAEISQTREAISQTHWQLDATSKTAMRVSDVPLALATFTKSYITNRAADAAMQAGAAGVMLNVGGDIVVRGGLTQMVDLADPQAAAENDAPLDRLVLRDCAVATSGSYRRGVELVSSTRAPEFSHIVDPRTAQPTGHIISSTVIARDAETAGAMATAFSVLSVAESEQLADRTKGIEYKIVTRDGRQVQSSGWSKYQSPSLRNVAFAPVHAAPVPAVGVWNPAFELALSLELPRIEDARYRRPYVAVWIEDADHYPVRTLALWTQNPRWLPELKQWYRDDQVRNLSENTDISKTVSSATRPPGHYSLKWDGKDNDGKLVRAGKYTVVVEAAREHGSYQIARHDMDFSGLPQQFVAPAGKELGAVTLDYRKR